MRPDLIRRELAMARSRRTQLLRQRRSQRRSQRRLRPPEDASQGERTEAEAAARPATAGHVGAMGAVLVVLAVLAGCSAGGTRTGNHAAAEQGGAEASSPESTAASPAGRAAVSGRQRPEGASCPVTTPTSPAEVPPVLRRAGESAWYGEGDLWVSLPGSPVTRGQEGSYPTKYGSFTLHEGGFTARHGPPETHARRLDGAGTVEAGFGGYAHTVDARFWPTGIEFPAPGCWVVTAALDDTKIRFVVRVGTEHDDATGQPPVP